MGRFFNYFKNDVGKVVTLIVNALEHSEALNDFLYHYLKCTLDFLAYFLFQVLQVPWVTFKILCLRSVTQKNHTGLIQVSHAMSRGCGQITS